MKKDEILKIPFKDLLKISRKSDDTSDPFDVLITDKLAMVMTRLFIRAGIAANAVSILSFAFALAGSFFIIPDALVLNIIGIAMEIYAVILDTSDGQIARLTDTASDMGRILDGFCDSLGTLSVYIALSFRLMDEPIPFLGGEVWGGWIWLLMAVYFSFFYPNQCSMADYYRNVHLYFMDPEKSELTRSDDILSDIRAFDRKTSIYERIFQTAYYLWTRLQEKQTPKLQRLFDMLKKRGELPKDISEKYVEKSRKYINLTNVLTYYLRAFTLYLMIILHLYAFFFPFAIIVLGIIERYMIIKYEKIAGELAATAFTC